MSLLLHIFDIAKGLAAGLIVIGFLAVLGFAAIPRRLQTFRTEKSHLAVVGAALAVLWLWYAIRLAIPLASAVNVLIVITCAAALLRSRSIIGTLRGMTRDDIRSLQSFVALFSLFYVVCYFFLTPPVSSSELPITRLGNNDILSYFISADYMQRLGPSNVAGYSYVDARSLVLTFVPATYNALTAVATLYGGETIRATMPTMFCVVALIGCVMTALMRFSFRFSAATAAIITALVISGPFFRYITGHFFLSTFVAELFLLLMMARTAVLTSEPQPKRLYVLVLWFVPYHFLLFYSYPPLYVIGLGLQFGFAFLCNMLASNEPMLPALRSRRLWNETGKWGGMAVISTAVILIVDPRRFSQIFDFLFHISSKGVGGWSLGLISPLGMIALPVPIQAPGAIAITATLFGFAAVAVTVAFIFLRDLRQKYPPSATALLLLSLLTFLAYFAYYISLGSSYQQWKIASYLPMFFAFGLLAAICCVWSSPAVAKPGRTRDAFLAVCLALLATNMLVHVFKRRPLDTFDANYANLKALETISDAKDIYVQMASYSSSFFPVYYIRNKTLHLLTPSYFPHEVLDPRSVSASKPLLVEGPSCDAGGPDISIPGVGCLHTAAPGLRPERPYLFNTAIPGLIQAAGFSLEDSAGKRSEGTKVRLRLLLDPAAVSLTNGGYLNFEIRPVSTAQNLSTTLGDDKAVVGRIETKGWISLRLRPVNLGGFESRELAVEFDLGDSSPNKSDMRIPGVELLAMSLSGAPAGRLLGE